MHKLFMAIDDAPLAVEVVYALPGEQMLLKVALPGGSTIRDAIERSGITRQHPEVDPETCKVGVFGKRRTQDTLLRDGDRVEIYRPLIADPKATRRARARKKERVRERAR